MWMNKQKSRIVFRGCDHPILAMVVVVVVMMEVTVAMIHLFDHFCCEKSEQLQISYLKRNII